MQTNTITPESFTRVNNDVNGNPRYVIHFLEILSQEEQNKFMGLSAVSNMYNLALAKAKAIGGRKHSTKAFGGGIVFQSYNLPTLAKQCNELLTIKN